jgi:hypothetical protein
MLTFPTAPQAAIPLTPSPSAGHANGDRRQSTGYCKASRRCRKICHPSLAHIFVGWCAGTRTVVAGPDSNLDRSVEELIGWLIFLTQREGSSSASGKKEKRLGWRLLALSESSALAVEQGAGCACARRRGQQQLWRASSDA